MAPTATQTDPHSNDFCDLLNRDLLDAIPEYDGEITGICSHCGESVTVEAGEELLHHYCWMQRELTDDLREKFTDCTKDLAMALNEYLFESQYRIPASTPDGKEAHDLVKRINAVLRAAR